MRTGENIYKRKDGRWEARYRKGRSDDGKILYGSCYGRTYTEAKEKAVSAARKAESGQKEPQQMRVCFFTVSNEWLAVNHLRLKESTYVKYGEILNKYLIPYFGNRELAEINAHLVQQFGEKLVGKHMLAPKTARDILLVLNAVLKYAGKRFPDLSGSVDMVYPKEARKELRVLSPSEQTALTEYLMDDVDCCKLGVLLALWTGIRIGELCALRWDHVDLEEGCIRIELTMQRLKDTRPDAPAKTRIIIDAPKSASSVRTIPLTQQSAALCRKMKPQDPSAYLLTGHRRYMEPRVLQYHFDRFVRGCGLENVHFHTLRHTFATRCVEVGFEIKSLSEILGHANTSITLNRYVHCSMNLKRDNMKKLETIGM